MPDSTPRDLVGVCEHAAEALSALLGRDDAIPSSLRRAAETAVSELSTVAKNLRAAKLNVEDEEDEILGDGALGAGPNLQ